MDPVRPAQGLSMLVPVHDDWNCLGTLTDRILNLKSPFPSSCLYVVNDGSLDPSQGDLLHSALALEPRVLHLGRNLGHQRAIAVGLVHLAGQPVFSPIIVMDSDGEDRPEALNEIWEAHLANPDAVIVAQRRNRTENVRFRFFYRAYRFAFRVLTGHRLDFGNFVLLPPMAVQRLVLMNELWNHFPAAIMRSRLPIVKVPIDRGVRYSGESRMNFTALVNHGLAAIAAFIDAVFVRLLVLTGVLLGLFSLAAVAVVAIRLWGTWGVPGWATTALGLILLGLLQLVGLLVVVTFLTLSMRSSSSPPPIQFAQQYITRVEKIQ